MIVLKVGIGVLKVGKGDSKLQFVDFKLGNAVLKLENAVLKLQSALLKLQNILLKLQNAPSFGRLLPFGLRLHRPRDEHRIGHNQPSAADARVPETAKGHAT
ncbi:MAG: hypothetical protein GTO22_21505 [Gemmatimonadales bacterium]|nr:hypothetical protein [Gemmatimonadales bacterium]